jgi:hypothetical protein
MLLRAVGPTELNSLGPKIVKNVGLLLPCPISTPLRVEWAVLLSIFLMLHLFNSSKILISHKPLMLYTSCLQPHILNAKPSST